jgi:hypothetical protein
MEKNLSYLRSKAWYRLLKVVFIFSFLIVLIVYNFIIAQDVRTVNERESKIICTGNIVDEALGTSKELRLDEMGTVAYGLSSYQREGIFDYEGYFKDYNARDIFDILGSCGRTIIGNKNFDIVGARKAGFSDSEIFNYLKPSFAENKPFEIKLLFTYKPFIKNLIVGNLIILALFEILRRIFYYVLLGTMRPAK